MRRLTLAALLPALLPALLAAAPPAQAQTNHTYYAGGCAADLAFDPTSKGDGLVGVISMSARSTNGGSPAMPTADPTYVRCDVYVGGTLRRYAALEGPGGPLMKAAPLRLASGFGSVVTICEHVTVGGYPETYECHDVEVHPELSDREREVIAWLWYGIHSFALREAAPTVCPALAALAGGYGPLIVDSEGDVYLFGRTRDELWYDCPPSADG